MPNDPIERALVRALVAVAIIIGALLAADALLTLAGLLPPVTP